jgi:hypothetical protein
VYLVTFHINPYKIVIIGKKNLTKQPFCTRIKVPIVLIFYMGYSKFYYALSKSKKGVTFACFIVTIYIEFELFNY